MSGFAYNSEEEDELSDMIAHQLHLGRNPGGPMTAGIVGSNMFQQQQQHAQLMLLQAQAQAQAQAAQLAMQGHVNGVPMDRTMQMQLEMMRLQAIQQQQQMMLAQAQMSQQTPAAPRRRGTESFTAGPLQTSFEFNAPPPQHRQSVDEVPMTAALGGKFGSRSFPNGLNPNANSFTSRSGEIPSTPNNTSVISGGTSLGHMTITPSKSDTAISWRRGSVPANNVRPLNKTPSPPRRAPSVVISPPPSEYSPRSSSPEDFPSPSTTKARPVPLRFSINGTNPTMTDSVEAVQVITVSGDADDGASTPTPTSSSSNHSSKEREEASKKLYEGLGIGRPAPSHAQVSTPVVTMRQASQPFRQPRGPPGGVDELGPRNFASRIRRKAIGGLESLVDARERRQSAVIVEAF
jgi:hypothetical protein